jgi:hypothetical protein
MYDAFNIPVTYETAPDEIRKIIDNHSKHGHDLLTMTCVSWESYGPIGQEPEDSRYIMLFKSLTGFVIHEAWLNPDGTLHSDGDVFMASDEADVFAGFMAKKKQEVA